MAIRSSLSIRIFYRLLWSKEQTLNWLINDKITMRECHTHCHGPHILCNTSCHHVNSRHLSQNSEIEDLLLLSLIEIQANDHRITQISLFNITKCSMSCCCDSQFSPELLPWHGYWCLVPVLLMGLRNTDCDAQLRNLSTEDAPLPPSCTWAGPHPYTTDRATSPRSLVPSPTCRGHYDSLPYNYGFFCPLQTSPSSHHLLSASTLNPLTSSWMHSQSVFESTEGHCITGTGDSYWRSLWGDSSAPTWHNGGRDSGDISPPPVFWQPGWVSG